MEQRLRTREEVEAIVRAKYTHTDKEAIEALTTLSLTGEELLADQRKKYPDTPEEILEKFAKDEETLAYNVLDSAIELGKWDYTIDEKEEGKI